MTSQRRRFWFPAFTAVFAVLAGIVFWGTWSPGVVPVMPDCATSFSYDRAGDLYRLWLNSGKFVPGDILTFIFDPYLIVEFQYAFALYLAACGMAYFLIGRGFSRFAAYSSGLFLAFCGYWCTLFSAGHLGWFQWMTYGVFAFGLIDRMLEKGKLRHSVALGAVVAWGSFYQADLWFIFTLFTAVYFIFRSVFVRPGWREWFCRSGVALAVLIVIGLPSFRSAFVSDLAGRDKQIEDGETLASDQQAGEKIGPEEKRWRFVTNWSMPPEDTKEFFVSRIHGDTSCQSVLSIGQARGFDVKPYTGRLGRPLKPDGKEEPAGNYRQHSLYVGWLTCILAIVGIASVFLKMRDDGRSIHGRRTMVVFFALSAVIFWLFSMGRYEEPVYRLVYAMPFGDYLRAPVKWHHLTEFCIVVLAAFGLELAWRESSRFRSVSAVRAVLVAVVLFGALDLALEAKRFCAPHTADTVAGPFPQPLPPNKDQLATVHAQMNYPPPQPAQIAELERQRAGFISQVKSFGLKVIGTVGREVQLQQDGAKVKLDYLVVEQKTQRPKPTTRDAEKELKGIAFLMACASVFVSLAVLVLLLVSLRLRKLDRLRIKFAPKA